MRTLVAFCFGLLLAGGCDQTPPAEITNYLEIDKGDLALGCMALNACLDQESSVSTCLKVSNLIASRTRWEVSDLSMNGPTLVSMLLNLDCITDSGGSCEEVSACVNNGIARRDCSDLSHCEGDEVVVCAAEYGGELHRYGAQMRIDCARFGMRCFGDEGDAFCAEKSSYASEQARYRCKGDLAIREWAGIRRASDCGTLGAVCGTLENAEGRAGCKGPGDPCAEFVTTCTDGIFTYCIDGHAASFPCADFDLACATGESGFARCELPDCEDAAEIEACEGSRLQYCGFQGPSEIDCAAMGYQGCGITEERAGCIE